MATLHFLAKEKTTADSVQKRVQELVGGSKITIKLPRSLEQDSFVIECKYIATAKLEDIKNTIINEVPGIEIKQP